MESQCYPPQWSKEWLGILTRGFEIPTWVCLGGGNRISCRQRLLPPGCGARKVESKVTNRVCSPVAEEAGVTGSILTECG
jgi:hypothetical protein